MLTNGLMFSTKYSENITVLEKWLGEKESEVEDIPCTACFEPTITKVLKETKELVRDFDSKKTDIDNIALLCDSIVENVEAGK